MSILVADTLDFCVLNPLVIGGLDILLMLGGNPWKCDCKLAYIKHLQSGRMMVSIIFYVVLNSFRGEYANKNSTGYRLIVRGHDKLYCCRQLLVNLDG